VGVLWLEPRRHGVRAWRVNLPEAEPLPGTQVEWRSDPRLADIHP
jgi:hypothetical protein